MKKCVVYGLYSSRDNELRYIGQTTQTPAYRLAQHRNYAKRKQTAVHKWFLREMAEGFNVELRVICDEAIFNVTETELIAQHKASGARLLNLTDGGEGTVGWRGNAGNKRPDLAERNRRNAGAVGRPLSDENRVRLRQANVGRKRPDTAERSKGNTYFAGRTHSKETRSKQSAALRGRVFSAESIERMRVARLAYWQARKAGA